MRKITEIIIIVVPLQRARTSALKILIAGIASEASTASAITS